MKLTREIKAAILVIGSVLLFIWGYSFLKGRNLFNTSHTYYVVYDNVEGLAPSAAVTINGLHVGKVNTITLEPKSGKLLVEILMTTDVDIPTNTTASIYEPSLIGAKAIALNLDFNSTEYAQDGAYLEGTVKLGLTDNIGSLLSPLQAKVDSVLSSLNTTLSSVNTILDAKTQQELKGTIASLNTTMHNFTSISKNVDQLLVENKSKLSSAVTNLDQTTKSFANIASDLEKAELDKLVNELQSTLTKVNGLLADIEQGNGTVGKIFKDPEMYDNLTKASNELNLLLQDVRLNPTRYINISVFGKKNKPYVVPETIEVVEQ
ncbi:MlaD family protein [Flavobacterium agricola]|uniref:MlaD family protein n=1 Tax=Flavobacterium agricola TaxID=2870839 RepID=A0ABY6M3X4_9FLAO|nr:MlaD family protein [Flavobacterium agricola]UYW02230.1 MlaD family protein [Flavobacterium agricola]